MNNLYWIKSEKGEKIKFKLNKIQQVLLRGLWYLNIILKARQHGITTFFCILYLDEFIFGLKDAAIIAHTLEDSQKIFDDKVKYGWDNLPNWLKGQYTVDLDNARTLKISRGQEKATFYVGTSLRGGTYQLLHITELGTLDQKYPEKSEEIMTGALNTVHKGQVITIESTSKGSYGNFYDLCQRAIVKQRAREKLTELDYKFFFFGWFLKEEYALEDKGVISGELQDYFKKIEQDLGIKLTEGQKLWYSKKKETQKENMLSEFPSTEEEAFFSNIEGSYYSKEISKLREKNHITKVPYEPRLLVDTFWDLGIGDEMAIWFVQQSGFEIRIIDCYNNSGEGLPFYIKFLKEKPYIYGNHFAPHDIEVKELTTGKSRLETARSLGINFLIVPKLEIQDGIDAVRNILLKCWFDEEKCEKGLRALNEYRKEWDDKRGVFKSMPFKNWACHLADAFRYLAVGLREDISRFNLLDKEEQELLNEQIKQESNSFNLMENL